MKILIVVDDFSDGAGNIAQLLSLKLRDEGHYVSLLLMNPHSSPRYNLRKINVIEKNIKIKSGNKILSFISNIFCSIRDVHYVVKQTQCNFIISFLDNNNTIVCLSQWFSKIPIIVSERSNPLVIYPKFPWNYLRRIGYRRAGLVAVQFDLFKDFDNKRFVNKCVTIPNIIMKSPFVKEKLEDCHVSYVSLGRNHEIKQYPLMISMFVSFLKKCPNAELHIFGSNLIDSNLQFFINNSHAENNIFLHDPIHNVHQELIKHDVYLMTSRQEGFPNALSEAMACGLPVVSFACHDGLKDLIHNSINGYLIAEGEIYSFIEAMEILYYDNDKRKSFGLESLNIANLFDYSSIMQIWKKNINILLAKHQNLS